VTTRHLMRMTLIALIPGALAMVYFFGFGVLLNLFIAGLFSLGLERAYHHLRSQPRVEGSDEAALLTGLLFALCLPPFVPFFALLVGVVTGLLLGKYIYGGLGNNPFNPALVGYCFIMISFPAEMTFWHHSAGINWDWTAVWLAKGSASLADGYSGATLLDVFRHRGAQTVSESLASVSYRDLPSVWINFGFLIGGLYLLRQSVIRYQAPFGFLLGLILPTLVFYDAGSSASLGSPVFHLVTGGTMIAAFFIVTDPVSGPDRLQSLFWFGLMAGTLTFILRGWSAYPDGIAFAILIANVFAPLLDRLVSSAQAGSRTS